jgi:hypothetical protein
MRIINAEHVVSEKRAGNHSLKCGEKCANNSELKVRKVRKEEKQMVNRIAIFFVLHQTKMGKIYQKNTKWL